MIQVQEKEAEAGMGEYIGRGTEFISRQPIVNRACKVIAYKIAVSQPGVDLCATSLLSETHLGLVIRQLAGQHRVFIKASRELIMNGALHQLSPEHIIVEIGEEFGGDDLPAITALQRLHREGYMIAIDNIMSVDPDLLSVAAIAKMDSSSCRATQRHASATHLKSQGLLLIAEQVDTREKFVRCVSCGCDYFQGGFFLDPEPCGGEQLEPAREAALRLVELTANDNTNTDSFVDLIGSDPTITCRLLQFVNSPLSRRRATHHRADSIRHAVMLLGMRKLAQLATFLSLTSSNHKSPALLQTTLARARMCELISRKTGVSVPSRLYLVGMVSLFGTFFGQPLDKLLRDLSLSRELLEAVFEHRGIEGAILKQVIAFEQGDWSYLEPFSIASPPVLQSAYAEAMRWVDAVMALYTEQ